MTPTNVGSTRPTDAEVLDTLRTAAFALDIAAEDLDSDDIVNPKATRNIKVWAGRLMELGNNIAAALEAASADKTGSLHRSGCSPDCSTHHRMTNEAPYNDEPYTVSGVDYTFRFAINPRKPIGQFAAAAALEAASAEPSPLADITTIGQLFEMIDWDFDGNGLTVTDGNLLANTIANTFPTLKNDMPHLVTTNDGQLGDGTDGQDRESYSDTQDRKSYTPTEV